MDKRKGMGITIFILCISAFFVYAYLLMLSEWSGVVLQLSVLMITGGLLGVIAWIGYTMATTKSTSSSITFDDEK
jgi:hypothetical protein